MKTKNIIYYLYLILLFGIFVFVESQRPREVNWSYNFSGSGKMPYGCYVLRTLIPEIYSSGIVVNNYNNIYEWKSTCNDSNNNVLLVISNSFIINSLEYKYLADFVSSGNKVFISAFWFSQNLFDSLGFKLEFNSFKGISNSNIRLNFTMPQLTIKSGYRYNINGFEYFRNFDSSKTVVLARDSNNNAVFIKIPYGNGSFYISSTPILFTNYFMLYSSPEYAMKCMSFLKGKIITWDDYYKPEGAAVFKSSSPIRYILTKPSLKTAYYLLLFTAIFYLLFEGRRKQKMIPVYLRPTNSSLDFIETVSMLYFNKRKNKNLAEKRITYLYDHIYNHFYIKFDETDPSFIPVLSEKAKVAETLIIKIFNTIAWIRKQNDISEAELLDFIRQTDRFMNYE